MRIAVIGSRTYTDVERIEEVLDGIADQVRDFFGDTDRITIVSGGAKGVDSIAENWSRRRGLGTNIFRPDYYKHGKGATFVRNRDIVDASEWVIAFWDGLSRGTKYTIDYAKKQGIHTDVYVDGKLQSEKDMEWWNGEFKQ